MSLLLEVEFLTGAYRGAEEPASPLADWPPQPDRIFSALVSSWAARGGNDEEEDALKWLESQEPPSVHASDCWFRNAPDVFVPPNDPQVSRTPATYQQVLPATRRRQPRRFQAACPRDPTLTIAWQAEPDERCIEALRRLAHDVSYVGHSTSLVRCHFTLGVAEDLRHPAAPPRRVVYSGRLEELESAYRVNGVRPVIRAGATVAPDLDSATSADRRTEEPEWLVLEVMSDWRPDLLASGVLCRDLRRTLMSGYRQIDLANRIPEVVSGHAADGRPTKQPHVAIIPMAFVGREHASAAIFGFAVVPPAGVELAEIPGFPAAFDAVSKYEEQEQRRLLSVDGAGPDGSIDLSPVAGETAGSLSPAEYRRPARVWATVTPVVLDRHLKSFDDLEKRQILVSSCVNAGLPRPEPRKIQVTRHSAVLGVPSVVTGRSAPPWTKWRVPESLRTRTLVHAVIEFPEPVAGPVMLGAGRFTGLGLFRRVRA